MARLARVMRKLSIWLAVAACICAAGCTSKVRGEATAAAPNGPASSSSHATSAAAGPSGSNPSGSSGPSSSSDPGSSGAGSGPSTELSAFRTTDVCSYLRTDAFKQIDAKANAQFTDGDYSSCYLSVEIKDKQNKISAYSIANQFVDGSDAKVIGSRLEATLQRSSRSGMTVFSGTSKQSGCARAVVLSDALTLTLTAKNNAGAPATACPIADAMLDSAISVISDGPPGKLKMSANALAGQDLCAKLGPAAAQYLGGAPTTTQQLHGCVWSNGVRNSVSISLDIDTWPPGFPTTNAKSENIAGHPASVGVNPGAGGTFSISQLRMSAAPISPQQFDVITTIAVSKDAPDAVKPKITTFLAAVAGLS